MEQKYVVFKFEDWRVIRNQLVNDAWREATDKELIEDCFVIRFQDKLAGPGLHAYAGAAQTMIEGVELATIGESTGLILGALVRVRDAAFEAANAADNYPNKKVPD